MSSARYVSSAPNHRLLPLLQAGGGLPLPEIALLGRSNVGKSSLINYLFGTRGKGLARVSSTPGKTQQLHLFIWESLAVVDLPGYGFAEVPLSVQKKWGPMVHKYLEQRLPLRLVLFAWDVRRDPGPEERQLLHWLRAHDRTVALAVTKGDKVVQGKRKARMNQLAQLFGALLEGAPPPMALLSAHEGWGKKELLNLLAPLTQVIDPREAAP